LDRIKELAKLEKEEADREVVKSLESQKKADDILALLGL
jgi:flagellar biosynthesis chaperone FliJ